MTIPTIILSTTPENILSNITCPEKCETCNEESNKLNLCLSCNENKQYYKLYMNSEQTYYECIQLSSHNNNLFFNEKLKIFNICYETCKTCYDTGDPSSHKCLTCDVDHHFVPGVNHPDNCITECKYYYYFTYFDQYKCTVYPQCPEEAKYFIPDKKNV